MRPLLCLFLAFGTAPVTAQSRPIAPAKSVLFSRASAGAVADTVKVDDGISQKRGALVGTLVGGAVGYFFAGLRFGGEQVGLDASGNSDVAPQDRAVGAVVGGVAGLLIGGALAGPRVPKPREPTPPEPTVVLPPLPEDTGVKWWQGASVGAGVGALVAVGLAFAFDLSADADGGSARGLDPVTIFTFGTLGGLIGLVVGGSLAQAH